MKLHIPSFLTACLSTILGLVLQVRPTIEDLRFSIIFLMMGFILFILSLFKKSNRPNND